MVPSLTPEQVVSKLHEIIEGVQNGRLRFVVCTYCLEGGGDPRVLPSGLFGVTNNAEGGFVQLARNDADPAEIVRCVGETSALLHNQEAKRLSSAG